MIEAALPSGIGGSKRAALRLAMLSATDRRWVLKRLPRLERDILEELIRPLLRIQPGDLRQALAELPLSSNPPVAPEQQVTTQAVEPGEDASVLAVASVDEVVALLHELPQTCWSLLHERMPKSRQHVLSAAFVRVEAPREAAALTGVTDEFKAALFNAIEWRAALNRSGNAAEARGAGSGRKVAE